MLGFAHDIYTRITVGLIPLNLQFQFAVACIVGDTFAICARFGVSIFPTFGKYHSTQLPKFPGCSVSAAIDDSPLQVEASPDLDILMFTADVMRGQGGKKSNEDYLVMG